MDMGFVIFYLVYAFFYNWAYDRMFPIPAAATATITVDEPVTREKASVL
ncbi:MAG: chlorhexidine efflux transporter [Shewanella sp.]